MIRLAAGEGCAEHVVEDLFRAYFVEGLDIGHAETLVGLAARAGLDEAETCRYLMGDAGTKARRRATAATLCCVGA